MTIFYIELRRRGSPAYIRAALMDAIAMGDSEAAAHLTILLVQTLRRHYPELCRG